MLTRVQIGHEDLNPPKVFISYAHDDAAFVQRLGSDLTRATVPIWLDLHEIKVGDSIPDKIGTGVESVEFFAIVLSPSSVDSPWVKQELSAALMRELEIRRVFVLPILYKDCQIPALLKPKRFADFRASYERGFDEFLDALFGTGRIDAKASTAADVEIGSANDQTFVRFREDLGLVMGREMSADTLSDLGRRLGLPMASTELPIPRLVDHLVETSAAAGRFMQLVDAVIEYLETITAAKPETGRTPIDLRFSRLFRELHADPSIRRGEYAPSRLADGSVDLASPIRDVVAVTVLFRTTGERFRVLLPKALQCGFAARRIVGELFLEELPPWRRSVYLEGSEFVLCLGPRDFGVETLAEAGIHDGDQVCVRSEAKYPWAHDATMAYHLRNLSQQRWKEDVGYRLLGHMRRRVATRLGPRFLFLSGPP